MSNAPDATLRANIESMREDGFFAHRHAVRMVATKGSTEATRMRTRVAIAGMAS